MKRIAAIVLFAVATMSAFAQGTAMDFIRADRNPATLGLAGAGSASFSVGTAFTAFGNPALVPLSEHSYDLAGVFGVAPSGDAGATHFGGGASARFGGFGVSAAYLGGKYPEIPLYSEGGGASGHATPKDMMTALGLSFAIGENLSFGAVGRYATSALDAKTTLTSISADIMALYRRDALSVTAGVVGLGPKVKSVSNRTYPLPASAKVAAAYKMGFGDLSTEVMADVDYYFSGNLGAALGVQGSYKDMAFLRLGGRLATAKEDFNVAPVPSMFTVGAGVKLFGVVFDAAYVIGGPVMAGLGYRF